MLTVDASVWVAAADRLDVYSDESRRFLAAIVQRQLRVYLPSFALVEIACALARRRRDAEAGRQLAAALLAGQGVVHVQLDTAFMARALIAGTSAFLRAADALYAATAESNKAQLVSWDEELLRRAGAVTPSTWLAANP